MEGQTVRQWLEELASGNTSSEQDDTKMQDLLYRIGEYRAVCTCGIVYLDGRGTLEAPPMPIQSIAGMLIKAGRR